MGKRDLEKDLEQIRWFITANGLRNEVSKNNVMYHDRERAIIAEHAIQRALEAEKDNTDLLLHEMELKEGKIDMKVSGENANIFMQRLIQFFKQNGGKNFLTIEVGLKGENYAITIQNCNGKDSPQAMLKRYKEALEIARTFIPGFQTCDVGQCKQCGGFTPSGCQTYCAECAGKIVDEALGVQDA